MLNSSVTNAPKNAPAKKMSLLTSSAFYKIMDNDSPAKGMKDERKCNAIKMKIA